MIQNGQTEEASSKISNYLKKNKLNNEDRVKFSEFYLWLGNMERALKILGAPPNLEEINSLSDEAQLLLIRRADLFHIMGANHSAESIFEVLTNPPKSQGQKFFFYFWKGRLALTRYSYQEAHDYFQQALTENGNHLFAKLGVADSLEGLGKTEDALKILDWISVEEIHLRAIIEQMKGEYLTKAGKFKNALKHFEASEELFGKETSSKDKAYLYQWWGVNLFEQNLKKESAEKFHQAKQMILENGAQSTMLIALDYFLYKLDEASYSDQVNLFLETTYSPYRHLLSVSEKASKYKLHPWIESKMAVAEYDAIYLKPSKQKLELLKSAEWTPAGGRLFKFN